jgi:DNA-binding LytR/AlgR family response regulator
MEKDQIGVLIIESDPVAQMQIIQSFQDISLFSFIETAEDSDVALLKIIELNPNLIFLEYPIKGKTGNGILKFIQTKHPDTTIVFVSESKEYAAEAIHHEVYQYLLKPIRKIDLEKILEKVHRKKKTNSGSRINEIIEKNQKETRLIFNTIRGIIIINPDEILYCKADGSITELHFTNNSIEFTALFLSKIEEILVPYDFMRISRSMIINKNYIRKVFLTTNALILSANGEEFEVKGSRITIRALAKIYFE